MVTLISNSPDETLALGEAWGRAARPGLVIGLTGELGAGKTQLVKGLARGLDITARVTSPTFALVSEYRSGRLPLFHLDLYRLDTPEQIVAAGLEQYLFEPDGVAVVEWMERWMGEEVQGSKFKVLGSWSEVQGPESKVQSPKSKVQGQPGRYRHVVIETVSELVRRIRYEDLGA